jgi:hypothetical protein
MARRRRFRFDRLHVFHAPSAVLAGGEMRGPAHLEHVWIEDEAGLRALDAAAAADGYDHRPRQLRALLANGARICAAREDREIVGWCVFEPVRQTTFQWLHIHGGPGWIFGLGEYVRRDRRGLRIGPDIVRTATRRFLKEGAVHSASVVAMRNLAAIRTHEVTDGRRIGWFNGLRAAGGHAVIWSDRGVAVGRYDAKAPHVYRVRAPGREMACA